MVTRAGAGTRRWSRPERFLVLLSRGGEECRGKVVRLSDASERKFESMDELADWLRAHPPQDRESESDSESRVDSRAAGKGGEE